MIRDNSDWSENGQIIVKNQIQSEYWSIVYYSLLISISSFLITSCWIDRSSVLKKGDEVTVEPEDLSVAGCLEAVEGSFFATVHEAGQDIGRHVVYTVCNADGDHVAVQRQYLRHRRWHRIAFLQVTNDKKHDAWSSQAFADRRLKFFEIWQKEGVNAALSFAGNDRAEEARKESEEKASSHSAGSADSNDAGGEDADMARAAAIISAHEAGRAPSRRRPLLTSSFSQHQHEYWLASLEPERYVCVRVWVYVYICIYIYICI